MEAISYKSYRQSSKLFCTVYIRKYDQVGVIAGRGKFGWSMWKRNTTTGTYHMAVATGQAGQALASPIFNHRNHTHIDIAYYV